MKKEKEKKKSKNKTICKTCFWRWRSKYDGKDYCGIIENGTGGSIEANLTKCNFYLKKGTEPKWPCAICGKNTYGGSAVGEDGKWYCYSCYCKKEREKAEKERAVKIEKLKKLVGEKKAKDIIKLFNL